MKVQFIIFLYLLFLENNSISCPITKSISKLKNNFICHDTASTVFELHGDHKLYETQTFSEKMQDEYTGFMNQDKDHIYYHKLLVSECGKKINKHDFVVIMKKDNYRILQSMSEAFTLEQWLENDHTKINSKLLTFSFSKNTIKQHGIARLKRLYNESEIDTLKQAANLHSDFQAIENYLNKIAKNNTNGIIPKNAFFQKIIPTLFQVLRNTSDKPYLKLFATPRRYIGIKPEYEVSLKVCKKRI